jgi:hypothetical protein
MTAMGIAKTIKMKQVELKVQLATRLAPEFRSMVHNRQGERLSGLALFPTYEFKLES